VGDLGGFAFTAVDRHCENSFADEHGNRYITCLSCDWPDSDPDHIVVTARGNWTGKTKGGLIVSRDGARTWLRLPMPMGLSEELDALLTRISGARPKVAAYPFTTLHPVIGVVEYPDYVRVNVADIPGLIDGAHANVGLGHEFLRHIERTKVLIFVLDMGCVDGRTPWDDYANLKNELELYKEGLSARPSLIVANKMDIDGAAENLDKLKNELGPDAPPVFALDPEINCMEFENALRALVKANSDPEEAALRRL
jgi:ribosome-interacting GTPase 1